MELVTTLDQILSNAASYPEALANSARLQAQLARNRRWYLVPIGQDQVVANASYLGFVGASPAMYESLPADDMNLTRTLPVLGRFFRHVEPESAEGQHVCRAVARLLAGYGKVANRAASYWVRTHWTLPAAALAPGLHLGDVHLRQTIAASIYRGERLYVAECPTLGIVTQGATLDEVFDNLREAFELSFNESTAAELGLHPRAALVAQVEVARWAA